MCPWQEEYGPFTEDDIVPLAPTDEERETLKRQLIAKRERAHLAKKASKKSARREKAAAAAAASASSFPSPAAGAAPDRIKPTNGVAGGEAAADGLHMEGKGGGDAGERKKSKKRRRAEREAAAAAGGASAGPDSSRVAGAAAEVVKKSKESSKVYASLFGKKDVSNENLFIATAGHRYNLG